LLERTRYPWDVLKRILPRLDDRKELARQVLLREGYLYATDPEYGYALVQLVRADHLFDSPTIRIERGATVLDAKLGESGRYHYSSGPARGQPVRLILFDRLSEGSDRPESQDVLHRDFRDLEYRLFFERAEIERVTADHIVANLHYGRFTVPSLLRADGAELELACESTSDLDAKQLESYRASAAARHRSLQALRGAMLEQVHEKLPFDEPRIEIGQQDGRLRSNWQWAYGAGRSRYRFNGQWYSVFDEEGAPLVPQVCVDFLADTLERAAGGWWGDEGEPRSRSEGAFALGHRADPSLRRAQRFIGFAEANPDRFEVARYAANDWPPMGQKTRFFDRLIASAADFQPGDMVFIRGYTPWDAREMHYHSFFVYENDPVTGVPIAIVGNAGEPRVTTWEWEARRTPERSIRARIRPKAEWLNSTIPDDARRLRGAAPLAPPG
jgi:hypothetical protein